MKMVNELINNLWPYMEKMDTFCKGIIDLENNLFSQLNDTSTEEIVFEQEFSFEQLEILMLYIKLSDKQEQFKKVFNLINMQQYPLKCKLKKPSA